MSYIETATGKILEKDPLPVSAEAVKNYRRRTGKTQKDLSYALGMSGGYQSVVSKWESGSLPIPEKQQMQLSKLMQEETNIYKVLRDARTAAMTGLPDKPQEALAFIKGIEAMETEILKRRQQGNE